MITYQIAFNFTNPQNLIALNSRIDDLGPHSNFSEYVVLVKSDLSLQDIYEHLFPALGCSDKIIVTPLVYYLASLGKRPQ